MPLVVAKCTVCHKRITADSDKEAGICPECGSAFITEKAILAFAVEALESATEAIKNGEATITTATEETLRTPTADYSGDFGRGLTYMKLGDRTRAKECFEAATKQEPERALYWLGVPYATTEGFTKPHFLTIYNDEACNAYKNFVKLADERDYSEANALFGHDFHQDSYEFCEWVLNGFAESAFASVSRPVLDKVVKFANEGDTRALSLLVKQAEIYASVNYKSSFDSVIRLADALLALDTTLPDAYGCFLPLADYLASRPDNIGNRVRLGNLLNGIRRYAPEPIRKDYLARYAPLTNTSNKGVYTYYTDAPFEDNAERVLDLGEYLPEATQKVVFYGNVSTRFDTLRIPEGVVLENCNNFLELAFAEGTHTIARGTLLYQVNTHLIFHPLRIRIPSSVKSVEARMIQIKFNDPDVFPSADASDFSKSLAASQREGIVNAPLSCVVIVECAENALAPDWNMICSKVGRDVRQLSYITTVEQFAFCGGKGVPFEQLAKNKAFYDEYILTHQPTVLPAEEAKASEEVRTEEAVPEPSEESTPSVSQRTEKTQKIKVPVVKVLFMPDPKRKATEYLIDDRIVTIQKPLEVEVSDCGEHTVTYLKKTVTFPRGQSVIVEGFKKLFGVELRVTNRD